MKGYAHTTYKEDGTEEDVLDTHVAKALWDLSRDNKVLYSTDERGMTVRYTVIELSKDKFTYSQPQGPGDTLTFYYVPFSAKDTVNRKPPPPMMQPRAHSGPPQQGGPPQQQGNPSAQSAPPAPKGQK